jgi:hypothetical protein
MTNRKDAQNNGVVAQLPLLLSIPLNSRVQFYLRGMQQSLCDNGLVRAGLNVTVQNN